MDPVGPNACSDSESVVAAHHVDNECLLAAREKLGLMVIGDGRRSEVQQTECALHHKSSKNDAASQDDRGALKAATPRDPQDSELINNEITTNQYPTKT